jgi:hypothetical protein
MLQKYMHAEILILLFSQTLSPDQTHARYMWQPW